jgi:hypothetical protein
MAEIHALVIGIEALHCKGKSAAKIPILDIGMRCCAMNKCKRPSINLPRVNKIKIKEG